MKCVKHKKTGTVTRVTDDKAAQYVNAGTHAYAPKKEYKQTFAVRPTEKGTKK